ncbi:EAL domain-containing protein [Uliginosibacterium sp. H1]|uniref:EAL domain-containing protein n=1 Tax=Uliginosibacterium sp. H1 TaxID=3114757 RepID=UPI002E18C776|nr:EAL domain-containing protein [Uliginosibacterium sp. H1]
MKLLRLPGMTGALLAAIYAVTGWLSLQIAVPPGYAAPVFPPAGIALAALLVYGYRLWPAVLVGSLIVQLAAGVNTHVSGPAWWGPLLVAPFATLQALAGTWLARRLVGLRDALDTHRSIVLFFCVVAPLGCLVCASLAVPTLVLSGALHPGEALFSWWNWWLGDTLGVMVFAPLVLAFIGEPAEKWRPRRNVVALPLLVALAVLAFSFVQVREWEQVRVETQFRRDTENLASLVSRRLEAQLDMLIALQRLMSVSDNVTREQWHDFVMPLLERYPGTQNFSWNTYVTATDRERFERAVRAAGLQDFRVLDRDDAGQLFPAREADEYLPITYVEPMRGNERAVGMNPLSLPAATEGIAVTRVTGQPAASAAIRLVQEEGSQRGVVVYLAVFERPGNGNQGRSRKLKGMVTGAFRMGDAMSAVLMGMPVSGIDLCIVDMVGKPGNRRLYGEEGCDEPDARGTRLQQFVPITFADRPWSLVLRANDQYMSAVTSWAVWSTLAVGVGIVAMLGIFLLVTTGYTRRVEEQVRIRTSELALAGERLHDQQATLAEAQRLARMGSWVQVGSGDQIDGSDELRRMFGLPDSGLLHWPDLVAMVAAQDQTPLDLAVVHLRNEAGSAALDGTVRNARGETLVLHFQIESAPAADGSLHLRGTVQNVTAAREAEAHIQYLARYDALTGLPNRMDWTERTRASLLVAQRHGDRCAVLFLDLDRFKMVNDSLGHPVGDRLLTEVADRFGKCLRDYDVLARLGGDEFVVLLPRIGRAEDVAIVANKLIESLRAPVLIDQIELNVAVSIGIAAFPDDGNDVDTLLKHADVAMYGAKQAGRNTYRFFIPEMNQRAVDRLQTESALRRAIERHELTLYYQPQLDLATQQVTACEALLRWRHPERGLVPPMEFIPLAEDSGMIVPLGDWVMEEACRQQVRWAQAGLRMRVGINISALQFAQANFVDRVEQILAETAADPRMIELEITESALMAPTDELMSNLHRLGAACIGLALDDFGTGYSSLAYLKRLPIERLKLDRSFVMDLPGDVEDAAITTATLSMARDLGLQVVAEGVESEAQCDYLKRGGCQSIQGYLLARPMPAEEFVGWYRARSIAAKG